MAKGGLNQASPCDVRFVCTSAECGNTYSAKAADRLNKKCNCGSPLREPKGADLEAVQHKASTEYGMMTGYR